MWCFSRYIFFFDVSFVGYGFVVYLRLCDDSDRIYCIFFMGKVRFVLIKFVIISRLELTVVIVLIRVGELLKREVDGNFEFVYYIDFIIVLRYIVNE